MRYSKLIALAACVTLFQAQAGVRDSTFEGSPSVVLANDKLELTILRKGGVLASLILADDSEKLSPLWNPIGMARQLGETNHFQGAAGHFVCVDGFGPTSTEERAAGLPGHGEAHLQEFQVTSSASHAVSTLKISATLPIVQETFTRTFEAVDGESVIYVNSTLENLLGFDRPINWAEHATLGAPFLEPKVTVVDLSGSRSRTRPYDQKTNGPTQRRLASGEDFTWPQAPSLDGTTIDLRQAPENPHYLDHAATLLDPNSEIEWVTAINTKKRLVLGYIFRRADYPWIQYWGNYPPSGNLSRGMEFGTQPFDVSRREAVSTGKIFDTPTYRWLPAKSKISTRFLVFFAHVPDGFDKVDAVKLAGGQIVIEDHGAQKQIKLAASKGL